MLSIDSSLIMFVAQYPHVGVYMGYVVNNMTPKFWVGLKCEHYKLF